MTFKERLEIEHPEYVNEARIGGCFDCPHSFGYEKREDSLKNCSSKGGKGCVYCWNREIPVDEFKPGDKVRLRKGLKVGCEYDGIVLLRGMNFDDIGIVVERNIHGNYEVIVSHSLLPYRYSPVMLEKVEEREEKKMKFKVGDKVRTTKERNFLGCKVFPIRTTGIIEEVRTNSDLPYMVTSEGDHWYYSEDMLEKVVFSKDDLKNGMLIEHRDGERMLWINKTGRGINRFSLGYTDELNGLFGNPNLDIIKVGYPSKAAVTIKDMIEYDFSEIIWERKEEPVTKDVSLEELNAILKEKFPDVDKFNLPIEE